MMNPSLGVEHPEDWVGQIMTAVQGLSWMSETDAPFEVLCWTEISSEGLTSEVVLSHAQLPPETPIEAISLDEFLTPVTQPQPWHSEEEAQNVEKFQALQTLLLQTLTQIQIYRCGTVEIEIYVVGRGPDLTWLALHTSAVET